MTTRTGKVLPAGQSQLEYIGFAKGFARDIWKPRVIRYHPGWLDDISSPLAWEDAQGRKDVAGGVDYGNLKYYNLPIM